VAPKDQTNKKMISNIMEMKARGATAIIVMEEGDKEIEELAKWKLEVPKGYSEMLSTIPYIIPLQVLAYYTAVRKNLSPDMPRNLAKAVSVL
jgi:glucosamine--fructose-6-phosphate aminotransferase (isomerizing)